ncbi:CBS domain-containing protein [candidate division KSB1 bacterium]
MKYVKEILKKKGNEVWTVSPNDIVFTALQIMAEKNVGALLVMDNERIVGIISERDYTRKVVLREKTSKDTPVSEIMTSNVLYASPDQTLEECLALMSDKRVRHLPVFEDEKLTGIISLGDVGEAIIDDHKNYINQIEQYVYGKF